MLCKQNFFTFWHSLQQGVWMEKDVPCNGLKFLMTFCNKYYIPNQSSLNKTK